MPEMRGWEVNDGLQLNAGKRSFNKISGSRRRADN
jgi:hypothetical protein